MSSPRDPDHPQSRWKRAITLAGAVSALNQGVADRRNGEAQLKHTAVRSRWASKTEYLLAMIGYAVGLGNLWRFPYLVFSNGGGAFLIPYFLALVFLGLPLYVLEVAIGQMFQLSSAAIWPKIHPRLAGVGLASTVVEFAVGCYYVIIVSWALHYTWLSAQSPFPFDAENSTDIWNDEVLELSDNAAELGGIVGHLQIAMFIAWTLTYIFTMNGIHSTGKAAYVTTTFPYIALVALAARVLTLPGAGDGVKFLFTFRWDALLDSNVWVAAVTQIFYSLGPGWGSIIAFASHNDRSTPFTRDAMFIASINSLTSIFGGIVVFGGIGFLANSTGQEIADMPLSGPGLAFITYPTLLAEFPLPGVFAIMFFLMLVALGLGSQFPMVIAVRQSLQDRGVFPKAWPKWFNNVICCGVMMIVGHIFVTQAGLYYLNLVDTFIASFALFLIVLLQLVGIVWVFGLKKFYHLVESTTGRAMSPMWGIMWRFVCTPGLIVLLGLSLNRFAQTDFTVLGCRAGFLDGLDCDGQGVDFIPRLAFGLSMAAVVPIVFMFIRNFNKKQGDGHEQLVGRIKWAHPELNAGEPETPRLIDTNATPDTIRDDDEPSPPEPELTSSDIVVVPK